MLVKQELLSSPQFSSILEIGPGGSGKTMALGSIHKVLRQRGLPTRIAIFDFDDDGAEPILRLAREGREWYGDKPGTVPPWIEDVILYRYQIKRRRLDPGKVGPSRDKNLAIDFMNDFNKLDEDRMDARTGTWREGQELGAIIFDSLTGLSELFEDYVWQSRNRELGEDGAKAVTWTEWNLLGENIRNAYMTAKGFPCYFLATAHIDAREEEVRSPQTRQAPSGNSNATLTTGNWRYVALLTKTLAMRIGKDFSVTLFNTADKTWRTQSSTKEHIEGIRSRGRDNLPPVIDKLDLSLVLDL